MKVDACQKHPLGLSPVNLCPDIEVMSKQAPRPVPCYPPLTPPLTQTYPKQARTSLAAPDARSPGPFGGGRSVLHVSTYPRTLSLPQARGSLPPPPHEAATHLSPGITPHPAMGLLSFVPANLRPVVVAILAIVVVIALLRPRNKPTQPLADGGTQDSAGQLGGSSSSSARVTARGPGFSLSTVGTLLEFREGEARLLPGAVDALRRICAVADVYLVTQLPKDTDELEVATLEVMTRAGVFEPGACERHKSMFCSTEDGRGAMIRQLAPATHVDTSPKVLRYLAPHLARVVYMDPTSRTIDADDPSKASIDTTRSLVDYAAQFTPVSA